MELPKICHSKIFWTIITASFAFTMFTYGINYNQTQDVKAEVDKRTQIVYSIPPALEKINNIDEKTNKLVEDVSFIKGKLEKLD